MKGPDRARAWTFTAACLLVLGVYGWGTRSGALEAIAASPAESYYNLLVRGFQAGHLSLARAVPPGLAQLADPYDPSANTRFRGSSAPLHDLSYYRGQLYLYFGPAPAMLLFWPYAALTGHYLPHRVATFLFCAAAFLAGAGLLRSVQRRYFPEVGAVALGGGTLALGLATGVPILLARAGVYEVAIACGAMGVFLSLAALWLALIRPATAGRWLAAASLAYGFAVAARPSLLPGAAVLLLPLAGGGAATIREKLRKLLAAAGPIVLIGLGLLLYNYERFGDPLEFGQRYQLAGDKQEELFRPRYLWFNFRAYFLEPVRWSRSFPFVGREASLPLPAGHPPPEDPFGVLLDVPLAWLALAAPFAWRGRPREGCDQLRRLAAALAWLGGSAVFVLCLFNNSCSRYEVDFLPEVILLAALGLLGLERALAGRPAVRRAVRGAWVLLLGLSAAFNLLAAVAHHAEARDDFAVLLAQSGRADEGIRVLEDNLPLEPDPAGARVNLGNALGRQGRTTEALAQYEAALRLDPEQFDARANLAATLTQSGRFAEALTQYQQVLRLRPGLAETYRHLGFVLARLGRRDEAIAAYEASLRLEPDAEALGNIAIALAAEGRLAEAVARFRAALQLQPDGAGLHANLGLALAQGGRMDQAAPEFAAAVRLAPASAPYHNYFGTALAELGHLDEAIAEYEAALRIDPANAVARENLAAARAQRAAPGR